MITESEFLEVSTEAARDYLDDLYKHQRPLNMDQVDYLATAMKNGEFDPTSPIAIAVQGAKMVLINGQHTLNAIIKANIPQKLLIVYYEVETQNQINRLYAHFDIGRNRTFADSVRAFEISAKTGLRDFHLIKSAAAIRYMMTGFPRGKGKTKYTNEQMIAKICEWQDTVAEYFRLIYQGEHLAKIRSSCAPVMAVQLIILKYQPDKGGEFVRQVVADDGLKQDDPRKALHKYLNTTATNIRQTGKWGQTNGQLARATAKCWDKYMRGIPLKTVYVKAENEMKNIIIRGTPYKGKFSTMEYPIGGGSGKKEVV